MSERKKWLAIYTRHRWEKKVFQILVNGGIEAYCPLNKIQRKWSDRVKIVEEPLFKSYVFVRILESEKSMVRTTNGVVNFVYWLGKPAILKDREIETIKKFLNDHDNILVEKFDLQPDEKIRINGGVFMDKEATVVGVSNNRVKVVIDSIGFALIATIDRSKISRLKR